MTFDLSPGDLLHIGDALTLTVLAVEGNLIRFGLATSEGAGLEACHVNIDGVIAYLKHGRNRWELN